MRCCRIFASPASTRPRPLWAFLFAASMIGGGARVLCGQANDRAPDRIRADLAAEMKQITECFSAFRGEGPAKGLLALRREPLMTWSDPTGKISAGAMWAWGERGRPYALLTMEISPDPGRGEDAQAWGIEFISLANGPLDVEASNEHRAKNASSADHSKPVLSGSIHWTPKRPGLTFRDVPDAPPVARTEQARLFQMKDLIRRFSGVAHPTRQPTALRLMPHPLDRYSDAETGQIDGTIFFFSIGTNPEVMVLLEAQGPTLDKATWRYAVAPVTVAPFEVAIDRKEVWAQPYHSDRLNKPDGSYFTVRLPRLKP
jgi:hypothetical protein